MAEKILARNINLMMVNVVTDAPPADVRPSLVQLWKAQGGDEWPEIGGAPFWPTGSREDAASPVYKAITEKFGQGYYMYPGVNKIDFDPKTETEPSGATFETEKERVLSNLRTAFSSAQSISYEGIQILPGRMVNKTVLRFVVRL